VTYIYIGNNTQLFDLDMRTSFLNKLNLKP
jgi:hypothetical protein